MIRHTVVMSLKHAAGSAEEKAFIDAAKTILPAIPGVKKFEVLRQVKKGTDYDFGLSMEFDDQAAYDTYTVHPAHQGFVQDWWMTNVIRFMEIDYVVV